MLLSSTIPGRLCGLSNLGRIPARELAILRMPNFSLTRRNAPVRRKRVTFRCLSQILVIAFLVVGYGEVSHASIFSDGFVVYVGDRPYPGDFDPYFNQPKIYRQPRYYESTSKKRKGNKVFKTTKVKDQYGRTVYKKTSSHKVKKKKK
jgi:hypothetical protein